MKTSRVHHATAVLVAALALGTAACASEGSSAQEAVTDSDGAAAVTVADNSFAAADLTVPTGATVTWEWADGASRHNVDGDDFESETQSEGAFAHRFDRPGTHDYRCTLHNGMSGTVTVVP